MNDNQFETLIKALKEEKSVTVYIDGQTGMPENHIVIGQCLDELVNIRHELKERNEILEVFVSAYCEVHGKCPSNLLRLNEF